MEPLLTFCLAALLFLSLPLPLFASEAIRVYPAARDRLLPWVWVNALGGGAAGLVLITTPLPPLAVLAVGGTLFVVCGTRMFARLAEVALSAITNSAMPLAPAEE